MRWQRPHRLTLVKLEELGISARGCRIQAYLDADGDDHRVVGRHVKDGGSRIREEVVASLLIRLWEVLRQRERRRDARLAGVLDDSHRYDLAQRADGNESPGLVREDDVVFVGKCGLFDAVEVDVRAARRERALRDA